MRFEAAMGVPLGGFLGVFFGTPVIAKPFTIFFDGIVKKHVRCFTGGACERVIVEPIVVACLAIIFAVNYGDGGLTIAICAWLGLGHVLPYLAG